jgi:septal ring factor EnvC (AmiA/AmiB activator)
MTPAERGALEEIASRLARNPYLLVSDVEGSLSDPNRLLLKAIYKPLKERDNELVRIATEQGNLPEKPKAVEEYRQVLLYEYNEHRKKAARLKGNEKKLADIQARVDRDRKQVAQHRASAWKAFDRLPAEHHSWLYPLSRAEPFPPSTRQVVPITALREGDDSADVEAIKTLLRKLLAE